jgi:site-specific recombinase XerD
VPKVIPEQDIRRLVRAASTLRNKAIIELMYATGCRAGEIVAMRVEHMDFRRHTVVVRGMGSERRVFFGDPAKKILKRYLGKRRKGVVFQADNLRQRGCVTRSCGQWNDTGAITLKDWIWFGIGLNTLAPAGSRESKR